jgi:hypothetical protein
MSVQISEAPEVRSNSQRQNKNSEPFTLRVLNPGAIAKKQEELKQQEERERLEQEEREQIASVMNADERLRGRCL